MEGGITTYHPILRAVGITFAALILCGEDARYIKKD